MSAPNAIIASPTNGLARVTMACADGSETDRCSKAKQQIAGTSLLIDGHGALLRGASGSGKSDLALRLVLSGCAALISDDITNVVRDKGRLYASAPNKIRGLLEVRGLGIVRFPAVGTSPLTAVIDLIDPEKVERMPSENVCWILGVQLPQFRLAAFEASTAAKVQLAVRLAAGNIMLVQ